MAVAWGCADLAPQRGSDNGTEPPRGKGHLIANRYHCPRDDRQSGGSERTPLPSDPAQNYNWNTARVRGRPLQRHAAHTAPMLKLSATKVVLVPRHNARESKKTPHPTTPLPLTLIRSGELHRERNVVSGRIFDHFNVVVRHFPAPRTRRANERTPPANFAFALNQRPWVFGVPRVQPVTSTHHAT